MLLLVDCLGSDALLGAGKSAVTPAIDGLRERGVCFPNAIAAATYTTPSVASLLTGLYPSAHGIRSLAGYRLPRGCHTLAAILQQQGYDTAAFVTGPLGPETGLDRGFGLYEHRDAADVCFGPWGGAFLRSFPERLRAPWFAFLHLWELHHPRYVAPEFEGESWGRTRYDRALSTVDAFVGRLLGKLDPTETLVVLTGDHGEKLAQGTARGLRSTVRWTINHAGPLKGLLERLIRSGRLPRGVRDFGVSMHGYHVYDVLARLPLIIAGGDGFAGGDVIEGQVRTVDVVPTVLDLLGAQVPHGPAGQGVSLREVASGARADLSPALIESHEATKMNTGLLVGIRTPEWKLCFAADDGDVPWELYNLRSDPAERRNVAGRFPDVARRLHRQALDLMAEGQRLALAPEALSADEQAIAERRLADLGYL
ncbi:MAG: hypothetical protein AMK73_03485 [Planctomycetes bacterium SM23_32]|nr:MAG: hypothetical protein AMK73_03485 [Planctomycetes bacterium SM23_32]